MHPRQQKNGLPPTCTVCGERSNGYHYEIVACDGCKNFYRRAILGAKLLRPCPFEEKCARNKFALKTCRACRFHRCTDLGMNPLCIESKIPEEDNPILQYALKRRQSNDPCGPSTSREQPLTISQPLKTPGFEVAKTIQQLKILEQALVTIRHSSFTPLPTDGISLDELLKGYSKLGTVHSLHPMQISNRKVWPHADLVYTVEHLKTFPFFHCLSELEQKQHARYVAVVASHLTSSWFAYRSGSDVTYYPDGSSVTVSCKDCIFGPESTRTGEDLACESSQKRQYHYDAIQRLKEENIDETEYNLLKAFAICDPGVEGLSPQNRAILEKEREVYLKCLFQYLQSKGYGMKAPAKLVSLLSMLEWLHLVNNKRKAHHLFRATMGLRPWYCKDITSDKPLLQDELYS